MITSRRGFITSVLAAPIAAKLMPIPHRTSARELLFSCTGVSEIIVYREALTERDRQDVHAYLNSKYGITDAS